MKDIFAFGLVLSLASLALSACGLLSHISASDPSAKEPAEQIYSDSCMNSAQAALGRGNIENLSVHTATKENRAVSMVTGIYRLSLDETAQNFVYRCYFQDGRMLQTAPVEFH